MIHALTCCLLLLIPEEPLKPDKPRFDHGKSYPSVVVEHLEISIVYFNVGRPMLIKNVTDEEVPERFLGPELTEVHLRVLNVGPSKKYTYTGWNGTSYSGQLNAAKLTDDAGSRYYIWHPSPGARLVERGCTGIVSLYPGQEIKEVILFEKPSGGAKTLKLELAGNAIDLPKDIVFDFPAVLRHAEVVRQREMQKKANEDQEKRAEQARRYAWVERIELQYCLGIAKPTAVLRLFPGNKSAYAVAGNKFGKWSVVSVHPVKRQIVIRNDDGKLVTLNEM